MIKDFLTDVEKIVVETDEENPTTIAEMFADASKETFVKEGYRVRFSFADLLDEYEKARREYELEYLKKRQEAWLKISADSNPHP